MLPGEVPSCLRGLSQVEKTLIARACPIMSVYRKHGGQRGYKGHVLNLPQDIQGFLDHLPCNVQEIPILLLCRNGQDNTHTDLHVRRDRVLSALEWLQSNNPFYSNITIDHMALQRLPHDRVPTELFSKRLFRRKSHHRSRRNSAIPALLQHSISSSFIYQP